MSKPRTFKISRILIASIALALIYYVVSCVPFQYDLSSNPAATSNSVVSPSPMPLDPESPWPKFRANALQNGRVAFKPVVNPALKPWTYRTGKGIFSSPVIDKEGTVYIGSADKRFYAIQRNGELKWSVETGEIIDSSALLDDMQRVFFGSGDGHVYALERTTGKVLWKFAAQTPEEVEHEFGEKTYNVNWFEGNVAMLPDGTLLAPNDNHVVYAIDRDSGKRKAHFLANEMVWSSPAVNANTGRLFFGSTNLALRTFFSYDIASGRKEWGNGGWGSVAASGMLTSDKPNGGVVAGGFDGYVRAYKQSGGQEIWSTGLRDHVYSSPGQLSTGAIIQPSADGTVYALDPSNGHILWTFDTLKSIRSSPAIDGNDVTYVGSGDGRLYAINPDGSLRWAYQFIDENRSDLNSSPALGHDGIVIAGENGGIFFMPYDYCLGEAGRNDAKCMQGPKNNLPLDGVFMLQTNPFGKLSLESHADIDANQALTFSLLVRINGHTQLADIDRDALKVEVSGNPEYKVDVAANRRFVTLTPRETWTKASGGSLKVSLSGDYLSGLSRFGLKFFGGSKGGQINSTHAFTVRSRGESKLPYAVPANAAGPSDVFELSRLSVPNPTMLPSWNQIGFDSLHYLAGVVTGNENSALLWVVGGKREGDKTVINPALQVRYPLMLNWDGGLVTLSNYDGFKINFVGSWDMPFASYRVTANADSSSGQLLSPATLSATALCDEIKFYGPGLKLMGMSEFDTGKMTVFGGMNLSVSKQDLGAARQDYVSATFTAAPTQASVVLSSSKLKATDHVYSLLLTDAKNHPLPLYYTHNTEVAVDASGVVNGVVLRFDAKERVVGPVRAWFIVDTYPVATTDLSFTK